METNQKNRAPEGERRPRQGNPPRKRPAPKPAHKGAKPAKPAKPAPKQPAKKAPPKRKPLAPAAKTKSRDKREAAARAARLKAMKQSVDAKNAQQTQFRRKVRKPRRPMQPIVYTQPQVFSRNRLLLQLGVIMAVVMAMILCLSIFFRVKVIEVSGANVYSSWAVRDASGIEEGDYLLTFSKAKAGARIRAELPYVERVRFGIKLPDTVIIDIVELDVVYAIKSQDGTTWLMTSEGRIVEQTEGGSAGTYTQILGVTLENPTSGEQAYAYEASEDPDASQPTAATDPSAAPATPPPVTVTARDRLNAVLKILEELEDNDIVGAAASVDVSNLNDIQLMYGTKYEVKLGGTGDMERKIAAMVAAINDPRMKNSMGILDVSFTTFGDQVGYTPFE